MGGGGLGGELGDGDVAAERARQLRSDAKVFLDEWEG